MNVTDKLYTEWAWRSKTGTPSMDNADDKAILDSLISDLTKDSIIAEYAPGYDKYFRENGFESTPR